MANELSFYCNSFDSKKLDHLVECMSNQHRTIQQTFTKFVFKWIRKCAENYRNGKYDGRNELACALCDEIEKQFGDRFNLPMV